jgi:sterol desaturase/sphingolipid hydroxylase (fatty acid hydroxylase superfamily)
MLYQLYCSTKFIVGIFSASSISAFLICKYKKVPFINIDTNFNKFVDKIEKIAITTSSFLGISIIVHSLFIEPALDKKWHTITGTIINMGMYSIISEMSFYFYHRIAHTKPFYKQIHSSHHLNIDVYPIDTFYIDKVDSIFSIGSLATPIILLNLNRFELSVMLYIYITSSYLTHSTAFFKHHAIHHKSFCWNYCLLNPMFDIIFSTYRE